MAQADEPLSPFNRAERASVLDDGRTVRDYVADVDGLERSRRERGLRASVSDLSPDDIASQRGGRQAQV